MTRAGFLHHLDEQRRSLKDEIEPDIAPVRGLSLEARAKLLESVCRDAMAILEARPDFERALQYRDARSEESMQTWLRLVARFRHHGRD